MAVRSDATTQRRKGFARSGHVALVGDDNLGPLGELGRIGCKLAIDDLIVLNGVTALIAARKVNDVHDQCGALDVPEEFVPQTLTLAGPFDKAGNVRDDKGTGLAGLNDAKVGDKRREGIIRHLGTSRAHTSNEGGLAHARHANKRGVSHELHLELNPVLKGRLALLGESGSPAHRRHKVDVALTASAARADYSALAGASEVRDLIQGLHGLRIKLAHNGATGHLENQVLTILAVTPGSLAMGAALRTEMVLEAIINKRGKLRIALENDIPTATAVSPIRTALGNERLTTE